MAKQTRYLQFQGKSKWSHLDQPDTKFNNEGLWKQTLYPNAESLTRIYELKKEGIKNLIKKDDDGEYITFSRPTQKLMKGKVKAFNPPEIVDKDGNPLPRNTRIGYGSDITINVEVYYGTFGRGAAAKEYCAARLSSVRIDNLVPFTKDDFHPDQKRLVKGLAEAPPQLF